MTDFFHEPLILVVLCALLGLFVGSFLNVVIHRLPRMMEREWQEQAAELRGEEPPSPPSTERYNLAVPRSSCPHCGHRIRAIENIPLISYVVLRGRCRHCSAPTNARYPLVECLTALVSAYAAIHFGASLALVGALFFLWAMIVLAFIDLDTQLLPDQITLPLLWLGLAFNLGATYVPLSSAVVGAMAGYLILWSVFWVFKLVTGKEGMGYGDFKLLAMLGAWGGWQVLPLTILLSSLVGAVLGIIILKSRGDSNATPLPFGPYLAIAGWIAIIWGDWITGSYLRFAGF